MPFARHSAYSFSRISVQKNAPPSGGIYGLSNAHGWIYIHAADNIQAALLGHLGHIGPLADLQSATGFTFELCEAGRRADRSARVYLAPRGRCLRSQ